MQLVVDIKPEKIKISNPKNQAHENEDPHDAGRDQA
jgi:hypothetical protein